MYLVLTCNAIIHANEREGEARILSMLAPCAVSAQDFLEKRRRGRRLELFKIST